MPNEKAENKMGVMPVNRLLITMAIPMMLSMMVQALYNVVDSMFVSRISENALTAVSLAFPVQNLMIAVSTGTGVGVNALLSRSLGEKDFNKVNKAANNAVFLAAASYVVFAVLGLLFAHRFFTIQTDDPEIIAYGTDYLRICMLCSFGLFGEIVFEKLLQSTGQTVFSMVTQGVGAILNIIFDPICIFGLFGFPRMGVAGAAAATVFGQIVGFIVGVLINQAKNHEIHLSRDILHPDPVTIREIYKVGVPSIIMASVGSVMTFGMNQILIAFTSTATAVFGVYFKLQSFIFMPVFGLNNGMVPIIAYNLGAAHPDRIMKTFKLAIIYAACIMLTGMAIFQLIPDKLLAIFDASENMLAIGIPALRIISTSFMLASFSVVSSSLFQAMGHGVLSLWVSLLRQLGVLLPAAYILSRIGGLSLVWFSYPIAEIFAVAICAVFARHIYQKEIVPLRSY